MRSKISLIRLALILPILLFCYPAQAQSLNHMPSGISLPKSIDGMEIKDRGQGIGKDNTGSFSYRNETDLIEILLFKARYPNASLWFLEGRDHLERLLSAGKPAATNTAIVTSVGTNEQNAIRQTFEFEKHYKSSGLAVIQFGDWIAFVMSTSKNMEASAQDDRLDRLLGTLTSTNLSTNRTVIIPECKALSLPEVRSNENSVPIEKVTLEMKAIGGIAAQLASQESNFSAENGLANEPDKYCRQQSFSGKTKWYRKIEDDVFRTWIRPMEVSGTAVLGMLVPFPTESDPENMIGVVLGNGYEKASVSAFYKEYPEPVFTQLRGMISIFSEPEYVFVEHGSNTISLVGEE